MTLDPIGLAAQNLTHEVGIRVARKALDHQKQQGEAAVALLQVAAVVAKSAPVPDGHGGIGSVIDVTA